MMGARLRGILFCEFHPTLGPQIAYQSPVDLISREQMQSIAMCIITKPELQHRLISLKAFGYCFMGYSVGIQNDRYSRNALLFNACFVLPHDIAVPEYEPVVVKLAEYFTTLELESGFISQEQTRKRIPEILHCILEDLNSHGECTIPVDGCNTIYLKVVLSPKQHRLVLDHEVPVLLWNTSAVAAHHWDLTAQSILPYIDGYNHVQKIASLSDVSLGLVRSAIQELFNHGVIALTPTFLYSNMYSLSPEIRQLSKDSKMQKECIAYVASNPDRPPNFRDIFMLFCALGPGVTVRDLCTRHDPASLGIDEQKLIVFGLVKGLLKILGKIPVLLSVEHSSSHKLKSLSKWLNGCYTYEEICCKSMAAGEPVQYEDIEKKTESEPFAVHVWRESKSRYS